MKDGISEMTGVESSKPVRHYGRFLFAAFLGALALVGCSRDPAVRKQKYYKSAANYLQKGKVNEAVIELRNALKLDPHYAQAGDMLGRIELQLGQYAQSYQALQGAVNDQPDYLPARRDLGSLYFVARDFPKAQEEAEY